MRPVAPVAGLGEGVGAEGGELLGAEELVDRGGDSNVCPREVDVVHDLRALVAEIPEVLETGRSGHASDVSGPPAPRQSAGTL